MFSWNLKRRFFMVSRCQCLFIGFLFLLHSVGAFIFVPTRSDYPQYYAIPNVLMVASSGRSGSTLLTEALEGQVEECFILKTHLFPPNVDYHGKVVFIFSDPNKIAESSLHLSVREPTSFGLRHFNHMEGADRTWLEKIESTACQTIDNNLLAYDALGVEKQLIHWLKLPKSTMTEGQVMAIKYENLWDEETVEALKVFLGLDGFVLPIRSKRGTCLEQLDEKEKDFRASYNMGTFDEPRYAAYEAARELWQSAPSFEFFSLVPLGDDYPIPQLLLPPPTPPAEVFQEEPPSPEPLPSKPPSPPLPRSKATHQTKRSKKNVPTRRAPKQRRARRTNA